MTAERVKSMLKSEPFRRFSLSLVDGRVFSVPHPEMLVVGPSDRVAILFEPGKDDYYFSVIDLALVATLEPEWTPPKRKGKRKNKQ